MPERASLAGKTRSANAIDVEWLKQAAVTMPLENVIFFIIYASRKNVKKTRVSNVFLFFSY